MSYNFRNKATTLKMNAMNKLPRSRALKIIPENYLFAAKLWGTYPKVNRLLLYKSLELYP